MSSLNKSHPNILKSGQKGRKQSSEIFAECNFGTTCSFYILLPLDKDKCFVISPKDLRVQLNRAFINVSGNGWIFRNTLMLQLRTRIFSASWPAWYKNTPEYGNIEKFRNLTYILDIWGTYTSVTLTTLISLQQSQGIQENPQCTKLNTFLLMCLGMAEYPETLWCCN